MKEVVRVLLVAVVLIAVVWGVCAYFKVDLWFVLTDGHP